MDIRCVGVVGCGLMGAGIAQVAAETGFEVLIKETDAGALQKGLQRIQVRWEKGLAKGKITPLAETIRSFEEICDGKWDHLPEAAFMYVGAIEEAEEQHKRMQASA